MNTPKIEFLGWDKPAIELVAERLHKGLTTPQTAARYRRATVVVPTAESGRRLREYMAKELLLLRNSSFVLSFIQ